jgi:hypothetical protein
MQFGFANDPEALSMHPISLAEAVLDVAMQFGFADDHEPLGPLEERPPQGFSSLCKPKELGSWTALKRDGRPLPQFV